MDERDYIWEEHCGYTHTWWEVWIDKVGCFTIGYSQHLIGCKVVHTYFAKQSSYLCDIKPVLVAIDYSNYLVGCFKRSGFSYNWIPQHLRGCKVAKSCFVNVKIKKESL